MLCFSIVLWLRWPGKSVPKNGRVRRIGCSRCGKICTTPARESDSEVKIVKSMARSEHSWKLKPPKFATHLRPRKIWKSQSFKADSLGALLEVEAAKICTTPARAIWKSKSLKTDSLGALLEVEVAKICTTPARESDV